MQHKVKSRSHRRPRQQKFAPRRRRVPHCRGMDAESTMACALSLGIGSRCRSPHGGESLPAPPNNQLCRGRLSCLPPPLLSSFLWPTFLIAPPREKDLNDPFFALLPPLSPLAGAKLWRQKRLPNFAAGEPMKPGLCVARWVQDLPPPPFFAEAQSVKITLFPTPWRGAGKPTRMLLAQNSPTLGIQISSRTSLCYAHGMQTSQSETMESEYTM